MNLHQQHQQQKSQHCTPTRQHHLHYQQQQQQQQQQLQQPQQKIKDVGVQVDWSLFADTDNHEIKTMYALTSNLISFDNNGGNKSTVITSSSSSSKNNNNSHKIEESSEMKEMRLMRQREFNLLGHLNDYRKRTDELKRKISLRDMQVERLEKELTKQKESLVEAKGKERELQYLINDLRLTIDDINERFREEAVLSKLRDAEHGELVGKLKNKIHKTKFRGENILIAPMDMNLMEFSPHSFNHRSTDHLDIENFDHHRRGSSSQCAAGGVFKLSASLGSISPTKKNNLTTMEDARRRSDDSGRLRKSIAKLTVNNPHDDSESDLSSSSAEWDDRSKWRTKNVNIHANKDRRRRRSKQAALAVVALVNNNTLTSGLSDSKLNSHENNNNNIANNHVKSNNNIVSNYNNIGLKVEDSPQRKGSPQAHRPHAINMQQQQPHHPLSPDQKRSLLLNSFVNNMD